MILGLVLVFPTSLLLCLLVAEGPGSQHPRHHGQGICVLVDS